MKTHEDFSEAGELTRIFNLWNEALSLSLSLSLFLSSLSLSLIKLPPSI